MRPLVIVSSLLALIYSQTTDPSSSATPLEESSTLDAFFANSTDFDNSTEANSTLVEGSGVVSLEGSGEVVEQYRFVLPIRKRRSPQTPPMPLGPRVKRQALNSQEQLPSTSSPPSVDSVESAEIIEDGSGNVVYESAGISQIRRKRDSKSKSSSSNISIDSLPREKRDTDENLKKVGAAAARIVVDIAQLTRDQDLLSVAIRRMQTDQEVRSWGQPTIFDVSPVGSAAATTTSTTMASPVGSSSSSVAFSSGYGTTTSGCVAEATCYNDTDCQGGYCRGNFLGTCNCNACLNYWQCYSDGDCGGFSQACNMTTNLCDCFKAFQKNGYSDTLEALARLCNVKQCRNATAAHDCYGLPCNTGRCYCSGQ